MTEALGDEMGDFRASCQIKLHLRGKNYSLDLASVNWYDHEYGAHRAVVEFFQNAWAEAQSGYQDDVQAAYDESRKDEIEEQEKNELARLKAKYEMPTPFSFQPSQR